MSKLDQSLKSDPSREGGPGQRQVPGSQCQAADVRQGNVSLIHCPCLLPGSGATRRNAAVGHGEERSPAPASLSPGTWLAKSNAAPQSTSCGMQHPERPVVPVADDTVTADDAGTADDSGTADDAWTADESSTPLRQQRQQREQEQTKQVLAPLSRGPQRVQGAFVPNQPWRLPRTRPRWEKAVLPLDK